MNLQKRRHYQPHLERRQRRQMWRRTSHSCSSCLCFADRRCAGHRRVACTGSTCFLQAARPASHAPATPGHSTCCFPPLLPLMQTDTELLPGMDELLGRHVDLAKVRKIGEGELLLCCLIVWMGEPRCWCALLFVSTALPTRCLPTPSPHRPQAPSARPSRRVAWCSSWCPWRATHW